MVNHSVKLVYILFLIFAAALFCVHYCLFRLTMFIVVCCYISKDVCLIFITQIIKKYFASLFFFIFCHHLSDHVQTAYLLLYALILFFYYILFYMSRVCILFLLYFVGLWANCRNGFSFNFFDIPSRSSQEINNKLAAVTTVQRNNCLL